MAEDVAIQGAESTAKIRSVVWVIVLPFITLGIYPFFWWYYIHRERYMQSGLNPVWQAQAPTPA